MTTLQYASGLIRELILPPRSLFLLLAIGLLLRYWRPQLGRNVIVISISLLFAISTPAGAWLLVRPLESLIPALAHSRNTGAHAIVVLAAGRMSDAPEYEGRDIPDYIALGRLRYAAKLHHETLLPVLASGGGSAHREPLAVGMARALQNEFQTPVRWIESHSYNTAENASYSAQILIPQGMRRILLVTDAMHMPRAVLAFTRAGFEVVPAPTLFFGSDRMGAYYFLPGAEGLRRSYYATYEWIGIFWYRLLY